MAADPTPFLVTDPRSQSLQRWFGLHGERYAATYSVWQGTWLVVLLLVAAAALARGRTQLAAAPTMARLSLLMLAAFLLLFEARSRYVFLYLPYVLVLAALSLALLAPVVSRRVRGLARGRRRQPAEPADHPGRTVHDHVGELHQVGLLGRGRAHDQAGQPVGAQVADRLEGLDVAEVVAAEDHPGGLLLGDERAHGVALVHVAGADLDDVAARARSPGGGARRGRRWAPGAARTRPRGRPCGGCAPRRRDPSARCRRRRRRHGAAPRAARARSSPGRPAGGASGSAARWPTTARCRTGRRRRAPRRGRASRRPARRGRPWRWPGGPVGR